MAARFCSNCGRPLTESERQFGVSTCGECEASASGTPFTPAEQGTLPSQPPPGETSVNLHIDYPERLSRWLLFVKWLFVIPAVIVVGLYGIAVFVTTFISFWAILFTGRYPSGLFDFARGFMALQARTYAYFPLLLTDQYPLASTPETEREVRYEVEEAEGLSRWLLLLKLASLLLGVVGTLTSVAGLVLFLAAIPAWFAILFTGRYPQGMFDFMVAVAQWIARVTAWEFLMRDEWSLFATTQGVGVLVGVGALAVAGLTIVNYATGGFSFEFETGDDQNQAGFIQEALATAAAEIEAEELGGPAGAGDDDALWGTPSAPPAPTPPPVAAPSADDDPFVGPADAPVTIIEFSDYQWPFCKRFRDETLDQVLETYDGRIRFVYRDFPLTAIHPYAQKAAEATECADDQGIFWEYHDLLFVNQSALDVASLKGYAAQLGLDIATFDDCLDTGKHSSEVEKDSEDARAYGVVGTPAFFINGELVSGAIPFEDYPDQSGAMQPGFKSKIDAALLGDGEADATRTGEVEELGGTAGAAEDDPFWGAEDAAVTIVEFTDYQWPFCKRFRDETLDQIRDTYEGKIKLVVRDFPLTSIHSYAQKAAEATECADDQGKFWEYHDVVFANQSAIDVDSLKGYAGQLGLDTGTFDECLDEGKQSSEVEKDLEDGRAFGVTGTPAFFINGQLVSGAQPFSVFQQVIDAALAGGGEAE